MAHHGRGGAGNVNNQPAPRLRQADLSTPTIKSTTYTTGRGGTGNMAVNDPANPGESRTAQDVEAPAAHSRSLSGTYHWGRGGEGNMTTVGGGGPTAAAAAKRQDSKERPRTKERGLSSEAREMQANGKRRGSFQAAVEKGRGMLGLKPNAKDSQPATPAADESAVS